MASDAFDISIPYDADALRYDLQYRSALGAGAVVSVTETRRGANQRWSVWTDATGGTFTLMAVSATTAPIAYNASASDIESALEATANISDVSVSGAGSEADPWIIDYLNPGSANVGLLVANTASLTGGTLTVTNLGAGLAPIQTIWTNARSGTFTLTYRTETSDPIAWNATAAQLDAILDKMTSFGLTNVTGSGTQADPWRVEIVTLGHASIPLFIADASNLGNPISTTPGPWIETALIDNVHTIAGLSPATRYEWQWRPVTISGAGVWSNIQSVTTDAADPDSLALPTIPNLKSQTATPRAFRLTGDPVLNARSYLIRYKRATDDEYIELPSGTPEFNLFSFDDPNLDADIAILPGEVWEGEAQAVGNGLTNTNGGFAKFQVTIPQLGGALTTMADARTVEVIKQNAPTAFIARQSSKFPDMVTMQWTPVPTGGGYELSWQREGFPQLEIDRVTLGADATEYEITGLVRRGRYIVRIKALANANYLESEEAVEYFYLNRARVTAPRDFKTRAVGQTSATLEWDANPNADSFSLRSREAGGEWSSPVTTTNTSRRFTGLTRDTDYEFECTAIGSEPWSDSFPAVIPVRTNPATVAIARPTMSTTISPDGESVNLTITAVPGRTDLIYFLRRTGDGGDDVLLQQFTASGTYTDDARVRGETYLYTLTAQLANDIYSLSAPYAVSTSVPIAVSITIDPIQLAPAVDFRYTRFTLTRGRAANATLTIGRSDNNHFGWQGSGISEHSPSNPFGSISPAPANSSLNHIYVTRWTGGNFRIYIANVSHKTVSSVTIGANTYTSSSAGVVSWTIDTLLGEQELRITVNSNPFPGPLTPLNDSNPLIGQTISVNIRYSDGTYEWPSGDTLAMTLDWDPVPNATHYRISYQPVQGQIAARRITVSDPRRQGGPYELDSSVLAGLTIGTEYYIAIQAVTASSFYVNSALVRLQVVFAADTAIPADRVDAPSLRAHRVAHDRTLLSIVMPSGEAGTLTLGRTPVSGFTTQTFTAGAIFEDDSVEASSPYTYFAFLTSTDPDVTSATLLTSWTTAADPGRVALPAPEIREVDQDSNAFAVWDPRMATSRYEVRRRLPFQLPWLSGFVSANSNLETVGAGFNYATLWDGLTDNERQTFFNDIPPAQLNLQVQVREKASAGSAVDADSLWANIVLTLQRPGQRF